MVVIANRRIDERKRVFVALTCVYGIGNTTAKKIVEGVGVDNKKVSELNPDEVSRIVKESEKYVLEDRLREEVQKRRNEKIYLGTYQGRRLEKGLPVHGQSTRHNSRTAKKMVRGKKKQQQTAFSKSKSSKKTRVEKKK